MDRDDKQAEAVNRVIARVARIEHVDRRQTSYFETLVHFIKANFGAGILAMGDAFSNAGLLLSPFLCVFVALVCIYCQHIIVLASNFTKQKFMLPVFPNYPETIDLAFVSGPPGYKKCANLIRKSVVIITIVTQLGFCTVYLMIAARSSKTIFESYGISLDKRVYMGIFLLPTILTCIIRSLKFLTPISLGSTILLFAAVFCTLYVSCHDLPPIESREYVADISKWPLFFGTVIFAFMVISLVIPLKIEMKTQRNFNKTMGVINVGNAIYISWILSVGMVGYLKYGHDVKGVLSMNIADHFLSTPVQIMIIFGILFSYALQFYVAADLLWNEIGSKWGPFKNPNSIDIMFRIGLVILTFVCGALIPKLNKMISLVGAVGGTVLALVFPPLCDIGLRHAPEEPLVSRWNCIFYFFDTLALILAVFGFIFGTYFSVKDLYIAFRDEGI